MNIGEKDIAALDFIINEITKSGYSIDSQKLTKSGMINEEDNRKVQSEFTRLLKVIEYYKVAQVTYDPNFMEYSRTKRTDL